MKPSQQRKNDFKAESKAMKAEIKAAKKEVSTANKTLKKDAKTIAKAERELGHWYYQEQKRSTAEGRRKLTRFCTVISTAEKEIAEFTERKDLASLRVTALKTELKEKKKALKRPEITDVQISE